MNSKAKEDLKYPEEWEIETLLDLTIRVKKGIFNLEPLNYVDEGVPFIRISDIAGQKLNLDKAKFITNEVHEKEYKTEFNPGDLILSKVGTLDRIAVIPKTISKVNISQNIIGIEPNKEIILSDFLAYYLRSSSGIDQLVRRTVKTTLPAIRVVELRKMEIPLPSFSEQRNIAFILTTVQEVIEKTEAVIQATQELKKSLMDHLFTYGPITITEQEQVQLKETEIGKIPAEWKLCLLGDLFNIKQGKALNKKAREGQNKRPFLRTSNVFWGRIDLTKVDQMHFEEEQIEKLQLTDMDLLVCEGGDVGRTAIWREELEACMYQNHLHRLRPKIEKIDRYFYMFWMQYAILLRTLYVSAANRTTIPNLSKTRLSQFKLPYPTPYVQKQISNYLKIMDTKIDVEKTTKHRFEQLFKSLLENLMTGKIRVKDLNLQNLKTVEMET